MYLKAYKRKIERLKKRVRKKQENDRRIKNNQYEFCMCKHLHFDPYNFFSIWTPVNLLFGYGQIIF